MTEPHSHGSQRAPATSYGRVFGLLLASAAGCGAASSVGPADEQKSLAEYDLGRDSFQNGRLREALEHAQKALKLNPDNADAAYLGVGVLLSFCAQDESSTDCRFKEAEALARKAIEASPEHRDAKNALGVILIHQKRYEDAIGVLKPLAHDILYASPEKAWGNLGWAYLERGDAEGAIDALRRAIAAQPLFCVGHYRLGLAYEKKGDLKLAREALTRAVDTDRPECKRLQDAWRARARVHAKQGAKAEARADFEKCRDLGTSTQAGHQCAEALQAAP